MRLPCNRTTVLISVSCSDHYFKYVKSDLQSAKSGQTYLVCPPFNAVITSATLSLSPAKYLSDNTRTIRVYRLKRAFDEGTVTWNNASSGVAWQAEGASGANDRESTDIGSVQILASEPLNTEKQISLSNAQIQEMVNGTFTNNGFIIVADTELNDRFNYKTSDASNASQRPKLVIQYTIPPTNTPTPTPTVTATPSQTPTVTQTPSLTPTLPVTVTPSHTFTPTPSLSGPITINYVYDPLYRLKEANYSTGDYYHYTYDTVGNRLTQNTLLAGLPMTATYAYDNANRLTSVNGVTYTWDNNGNLLNDGVNTYTYDSANRLKSLSNQSSVSSYQYNGLNDRLQETVNGNTTTFTMDLNTGLTQALSDGTNAYIYGNGRIAQTQGSATEYFLGDALGSVRQLTNQSGAFTYARAYDPYGVVTTTSGSSQSAYGYTNEYTSQGLVYLRARYYSPQSGRFLTRDMWHGDANDPLSLNKWNYVSGNPTNATDPTGLCEEIGDEACWGVYEEIIRWRPDLADATILDGHGEWIPLHKASHARLKYFLENNLWSCLTTPETGAINYAFKSSCDAIAWVDQHRTEIKGAAQRHGLPPELVAGVLASEIDFDYALADLLIDTELVVGGENAIAYYLLVWPDPGPGVASMHFSTWEIIYQYYLDCGYDLGPTLAPGGQTLSQYQWIMTLLTSSGSIEGASALTRLLADYRTGSGGQPNKTTHYNDLNFVDMAQIFGAYRAGVGGLTCFNDDDGDGLHECGFQNIGLFQGMHDLGGEARQAYPYFGFFQRYFEYYR